MFWTVVLACAPFTATMPELAPGAPLAGAAVVDLDLPWVGPLAGDASRSLWADPLVEVPLDWGGSLPASTGAAGALRARAVWLDNGDFGFLLVKVDASSPSPEWGVAAEAALVAEGADLPFSVMVVASGTAHGVGGAVPTLARAPWLEVGDAERARRVEASVREVAIAAWRARAPASIGVGVEPGWGEGSIVDSRPENDALDVTFSDEPLGGAPRGATVLRVDSLDGAPIAAVLFAPLPSRVVPVEVTLVSGDLSAAVEARFEDRAVVPVAVHVPTVTSGVEGALSGPAALDLLADAASASLARVWSDTPTLDVPFVLEGVTRSVWHGWTDVRVARGGTVDWRYADAAQDGLLFDRNGALIGAMEEFAAPSGAWCGPLAEGLDPLAEPAPFDQCTDVQDRLTSLTERAALPFPALPLVESLKSPIGAARLDGVVIHQGGASELGTVVFGGLPGALSQPLEQAFVRRAGEVLRADHIVAFGPMGADVGHLLVVEDWLRGGDDLAQTLYGPLIGEHLSEALAATVGEVLEGKRHEDPDPWGYYEVLPGAVVRSVAAPPADTPDAGEIVSLLDSGVWTADGVILDDSGSYSRVSSVAQVAWRGGDPGVDHPYVRVEVHVDGAWVPLARPGGTIVDSNGPDLRLVHTPPEASGGAHLWWAGWQVVGPPGGGEAAIPLGEYRIAGEGQRWHAGEEWPFETRRYEVTGPAFQVVAAQLSVHFDEGLVGVSFAAPEGAWRAVDGVTADVVDRYAVVGAVVTAVIDGRDEELAPVAISDGIAWFSRPSGALTSVDARDAYGNSGSWP
jgi:hypothetical protein